MALSASVLLKHPEQLDATLKEINDKGAPLGLQAVSWQGAAGILGQFIWVIGGVLSIVLVIIFLVTIVIINNSMVIATLERVAEIGTMRAIGAGKRFVLAMIIFETSVLGLATGSFGAACGWGWMMILHKVGLPGPNGFLQILFGGPRLYPDVPVFALVLALIATIVVSVAATLYPARLATKIQPVVAMAGKE